MPRDAPWWDAIRQTVEALRAHDSTGFSETGWDSPSVSSAYHRRCATLPIVMVSATDAQTTLRSRLVHLSHTTQEKHYFQAEHLLRALMMMLFGLASAPDSPATLPPALELLVSCVPKRQSSRLRVVQPGISDLQRLWGAHLSVRRLRELQTPPATTVSTPEGHLPGPRALTLALASVLRMWMSSRPFSERLFEGDTRLA